MEVSKNAGHPPNPNPKLDHFRIETYGFGDPSFSEAPISLLESFPTPKGDHQPVRSFEDYVGLFLKKDDFRSALLVGRFSLIKTGPFLNRRSGLDSGLFHPFVPVKTAFLPIFVGAWRVSYGYLKWREWKTCACMHVCIHTYRQTDRRHTQTDRQTDIHKYIHTYMHTCMHAHTHVCIYIYMLRIWMDIRSSGI